MPRPRPARRRPRPSRPASRVVVLPAPAAARTRGRTTRPRRRRSRGIVLPPAAWVAVALFALAATNLVYQVARKPSELWAVVPSQAKAPEETWEAYGGLFREHSTPILRPAFLAALVQVESAGDPLARTYWTWRWSWNPLEWWAPASSAVGLLQITDGTYQEARRFCIHDHAVARDDEGWDGCWFNALYLRTVPSHAIEMTSARLHAIVIDLLAAARRPAATLADRERLAAVVHLCGRERGSVFAARGFRPAAGERCGDHALGHYLGRVEGLVARFERLDLEDGESPARPREAR